MNYLDIKDFREEGWVQEINRQILHPAGLALTIQRDIETGEESLAGIIRDEDPEGFIYPENIIKEEKVQKVKELMEINRENREKRYGYFIQPPRKELKDKNSIDRDDHDIKFSKGFYDRMAKIGRDYVRKRNERKEK